MENILNETGKMANEKGEKLYDQAKKMTQKGAEEMKQSGLDWLDYIKQHPAQSIFFGLIGYFALCGLIKK